MSTLDLSGDPIRALAFLVAAAQRQDNPTGGVKAALAHFASLGLPDLANRDEAEKVLRDAFAEYPQPVTRGDTIHIVPELGPERVMQVSHVERHVITLIDDSDETAEAGR